MTSPNTPDKPLERLGDCAFSAPFGHGFATQPLRVFALRVLLTYRKREDLMPFPTEAVRSELYATLIGGGIVAQPMAAEDFYCTFCSQELWACECNVPPYQGADMTPYRTKERKHHG